CVQRQHLALAKQEHMISYRFAKNNLLIVADTERTVVFGQPLIEPDRHVANRIFNQQVRVLVENDRERILFPPYFRRKRDVVDILACLKISGQIGPGLKWLVGTVALEDYHPGWNRRIEHHTRKKMGEDFAKLFESDCHLLDFFFTGIAN